MAIQKYDENHSFTSLIEHGHNLKKDHDHIVDSVNLLVFTILLILVILTVWLFKYKRFTYIHETGLAIIYGTIFGVVIRYGFQRTNDPVLGLFAKNLTIKRLGDLPSRIHLTVPNHTEIFVYAYKYPQRSVDKTNRDYAEKATFDPEIFFNVLLPPIIFEAGYSMKKKNFFKNFGTILTFASIGTVISTFFTGGLLYSVLSFFKSIKEYFSLTDCLFFGAIISATDPVTVLAIFNDQKIHADLHAIIFGESVLNDAISIILAQAIEKYSHVTSKADKFDLAHFFLCIYDFLKVSVGSFVLGTTMGSVTALLTKLTEIRQHPNLETALFILMSYSTFLASEAVGLTGIISVLFCGIFQAHYTYNNLSNESQKNTKEFFSLLNFLSENFIFVYIGISLFTFDSHQWEIGFIIASVVSVVIARACNIYPLSYVINKFRSDSQKLRLNVQHLMVFSGLRGAMAFALAIRNTSTQARKLILTTTSTIVVITVIVCGGLTKKMLVWLGIPTESESNGQDTDSESDEDTKTDDSSNQQLLNNENKETEESLQNKAPKERIKKIVQKFNLVRIWTSFDSSFMKPLLIDTSNGVTHVRLQKTQSRS